MCSCYIPDFTLRFCLALERRGHVDEIDRETLCAKENEKKARNDEGLDLDSLCFRVHLFQQSIDRRF